MVRYRYDLVDARGAGSGVGNTLHELPFRCQSYSRLYSGVGTLIGSAPIDDARCSLAAFDLESGRDLTVVRAGQVVWNGPITGANRNLATRRWEITAREAHWTLGKRTIETDQFFPAGTDLFEIVRSFYDEVTAKTNGTLYRFTVDPANSGLTKTWRFGGRLRWNVLKMLDDLAADTFDYRMVYGQGASDDMATRFLEMAVDLGVDFGRVLEPGAGLLDVGVSMSLDDAANRAHAIGSGTLVHTSTSTPSYALGARLLEAVESVADRADPESVVEAAQDMTRALRPPIPLYTVVTKPTRALPFGSIDLGDFGPLYAPALGIDPAVDIKVTGIEVTPGPPERVTYLVEVAA